MHTKSWLVLAAVMASAMIGVLGSSGADGAAAPRVVRENIEWADIWLPGSDKTDRPHVLLIGDSITRAYYSAVEKDLGNRVYVGRLATSKSLGDPALLDEVALVLRQTHFDVIHCNNGMHGHGYTEEEYGRDLPKLIAVLRAGAPQAKLILATTTPQRTSGKLAQLTEFTEHIKARNALVRELAGKENIPVDDLFALLENHPDYYSADGTHSNGKGVEVEGKQVAAAIMAVLK